MKELPYYRFNPDEYLTGDITFEDFATQGVFNLVCCYYWKADCSITMQKLCKRIPNAEQMISKLIESKILKHSASTDEIKINFLHKQFQPLISVSKQRTNAANVRWTKYRDKMQKHSKSIAKADANKDKDKDKDKDKEKIYNIPSLFFSEQPETLPAQIEKQFAADCDWVIKNCPRVFQLERPLTAKQFYAACCEFSPILVKDKLASMDNDKKLLSKYTDAFKTLRNWCKPKTN